MTMNICEGFLNDSIDRNLDIAREPLEFLVNLQTYLNSTALRESIG